MRTPKKSYRLPAQKRLETNESHAFSEVTRNETLDLYLCGLKI
jgi:hypothetical protein